MSRSRGIDAVHAEELGLQSAPDAEILHRTTVENRVCVTLNHDFHQILSQTGADPLSVSPPRPSR